MSNIYYKYCFNSWWYYSHCLWATIAVSNFRNDIWKTQYMVVSLYEVNYLPIEYVVHWDFKYPVRRKCKTLVYALNVVVCNLNMKRQRWAIMKNEVENSKRVHWLFKRSFSRRDHIMLSHFSREKSAIRIFKFVIDTKPRNAI